MVDSAVSGTFNSTPHSKQVMRFSRGEWSGALGNGWSTSWMRKYWPHVLHLEEKAERGSDCRWPQCGQAIRTWSCFIANIQWPCALRRVSTPDQFSVRFGNFQRFRDA